MGDNESNRRNTHRKDETLSGRPIEEGNRKDKMEE
jgi:hypothetical protein